MSVLTKEDILQKAFEFKEQIFQYKTKGNKNIYDEVILQYYQNQLNSLIFQYPEIEEWEWMGWPSKETYEKEVEVIKTLLEEQFKEKDYSLSYIFSLRNNKIKI